MSQVVVSGLGIVSPIGNGVPAFWEALAAGRCGIRPLGLFPVDGYRTRLAAWIDEATLDTSFLSLLDRRQSCRADRFALVAVREALADSGLDLDRLPRERLAIALGNGASGLFEAEEWYRSLLASGRPGRPRQIANHFPDAASDRVARRFGLLGPRLTVTTACSSASLSVGLGADLLRAGLADVVVAGGTDALARHTYAGFNALRAVDPAPCRPFDRHRNGLSLGEGAGILVLEREAEARRRGAPIYARLEGYGVTADAYHMTAPEPTGEAAARTISAALEHARVEPDEVDYINAHGTATIHNDAAEAAAIHRVFGARAGKVPISSIKSMIGHALCAAGGLEAVATVLALRHQLLPPTMNFETPDPACKLDVVPNRSRPARVRVAISNSFAFGGNSACLVFRAGP